MHSAYWFYSERQLLCVSACCCVYEYDLMRSPIVEREVQKLKCSVSLLIHYEEAEVGSTFNMQNAS